jgi:hypothetical protein
MTAGHQFTWCKIVHTGTQVCAGRKLHTHTQNKDTHAYVVHYLSLNKCPRHSKHICYKLVTSDAFLMHERPSKQPTRTNMWPTQQLHKHASPACQSERKCKKHTKPVIFTTDNIAVIIVRRAVLAQVDGLFGRPPSLDRLYRGLPRHGGVCRQYNIVPLQSPRGFVPPQSMVHAHLETCRAKSESWLSCGISLARFRCLPKWQRMQVSQMVMQGF